jgi:hypothetical protein
MIRRKTFLLAIGIGAGLLAGITRADDITREPTEKSSPILVPPSDTAPATRKDEGDFVTEKRGDTTVKYKKKTTYDFEGANIDGLYNKPSGSYISNIKDVKARSIIRIRENFDAEVVDSSRAVK